ncbi:MAG: sialidase family protein, partial [Desulfuromonadales bacterium]
MKLVSRGTVFQSEEGTDRQSCAFPQVAVLPDGRWIASCRAAFTKGGKEGQHVLLSFSDDEGKTWSAQLSPFAAPEINGKPGQFRVCALTPLGGANVLAALYWVDNSDPSLPFF